MSPKDDSLMFITLFSLLSYYQFGRFTSFRNSVEKVLLYHGIMLNEETVSPMSWYILNRLNELGVVEKTIYREQHIWELCKNSTLSLSDSRHLLIGDKSFVDDVSRGLEAELGSHHVFSTPSKFGARLNFSVPSVDCLVSELQDVVSKISMVCHIDVKCNRLLRMLPTIDDYLKLASKTEPKLLVDKNQNVTVFNFSSRCWDPIDSDVIGNQGYYRVHERFGQDTFFIKTGLAHFEFKISDIGYVLACHLLNKQIPILYHKGENSIRINARDFIFLPVLLKRALVINSFSSPVFKGDQVEIKNMKPGEFKCLIGNYKIFTDKNYA